MTDDLARLSAENERLRARLAVVEARNGSAMTWVERYESKMGGLTMTLDNIKDSLTGKACVDATPGASTNSSRFAAGLAVLPAE